MGKLKYLSTFYKNHLTIDQQLSLGLFHSKLNYHNKQWKKHNICTGLHTEHSFNSHNPIARKKLTNHSNDRIKQHYIDSIAIQGIGTHRVTEIKDIKDKELYHYIDRYCCNCSSLLIRYDPDTLVCLSCNKKYRL